MDRQAPTPGARVRHVLPVHTRSDRADPAGAVDSAPAGGATPAQLLGLLPAAPEETVPGGWPPGPPPAPASARPAAPALERVPERSPRRLPGRRLSALLQVGALGVLTYLCLFNFSVVRGSSMAPRIHDGDRILIDHFSYLLTPVERGDIVVLKYPLDPSVDYIKRVIGLAGDKVVLKQGRVFVNGRALDEPYVDDPDGFTDMEVEVLPAHYFVLGDNRRRSCDSREFGQVPCDYVRGKVEVRVWPLGRVGRIDA